MRSRGEVELVTGEGEKTMAGKGLVMKGEKRKMEGGSSVMRRDVGWRRKKRSGEMGGLQLPLRDGGCSPKRED